MLDRRRRVLEDQGASQGLRGVYDEHTPESSIEIGEGVLLLKVGATGIELAAPDTQFAKPPR
jgi:hypothetical protein